MSIGIRNSFRLTASQTVTASVTQVIMGANTSGNSFQFNLGVAQRAHIRGVVPFTLGASGGYKFQILSSQTLTNFVNTYIVYDAVTPATIVDVQTSSAAFANALAVAGNHFLNFDCDLLMGATAGIVSLQFACNSAAGAIIALQGAFIDVTFV